jgi:hypothetical protein
MPVLSNPLEQYTMSQCLTRLSIHWMLPTLTSGNQCTPECRSGTPVNAAHKSVYNPSLFGTYVICRRGVLDTGYMPDTH